MNEKKFLTNSKISDIINTKRGRKTSQTRKAFIMKKSSLQSLVTLLTNSGELPEIKAEIEAELSKGQAKAEANRAVYADIHNKVIAVLSMSTQPVTAQEFADETGIARGKIVYGLTNYWGDEIVADKSGKTTTYRLA